MNQDIVIIQYKQLEFLPPVMSLLLSLKELGCSVHFIGVPSEAGDAFLAKHAIAHTYLPFDPGLYKNLTLVSKVTHRFARAKRFYPCRRTLRAAIKEVVQSSGGEPLIWFVDFKSAALLGNAYRRYPKRVVSLFEMHEDIGRTWWGFDFEDFVRTTQVVVPEYNRAHIIKEHYRLSRMPLVVANKPSGHPRKVDVPLPMAAQKVFDQIGDRPVFLYQGVWTPDRADVGRILETIAKNRPQYCVLVMPGNAAVEKLLKPYPNAFAVPYIAPPNHLAVTARATVGIAVYNASGTNYLQRLNAIYCAPNKIYEFAGFGIPVLGNDIPGLRYTIGQAKAGVCCALDEASILAAADELVTHIADYRARAHAFFDGTDINGQVGNVLNSVEVSK